MVVRIVQGYALGGIVFNWIIKVIGNADICPNAHLRMELMCLMSQAEINIFNQTQAVEAVISACYALNYEYLTGSLYGEFSILTLRRLMEVFERIMRIDYIPNDVIGNGCLLKYGAKLANELEYVNNKRMSSALHDVSCQYGLNPYKYTEPRGLYSLIALLETITGCVQVTPNNINRCFIYGRSDTVFNMLDILIKSFKTCFQMPQLTNVTAKLVMDSIEFLIVGISHNENSEKVLDNMIELDCMIKCLLMKRGPFSMETSPITREIVCRYGRKLLSVQDYVESWIGYDNLPTISYLLSHLEL
ncbi:unnamed protein product [Meganyctiphanes norvegica]|uniref:Uncharacterized protein n=1 Tax=Meganyctiphanes norvegica TaxID=48144 RepID=A0AAV2SH63_MEGNR